MKKNNYHDALYPIHNRVGRLLVFVIALLMLPSVANAWDDLTLKGSFDNWGTGISLTRNSGNEFSGTFTPSSSSLSSIELKLYNSQDKGTWWGVNTATTTSFTGNTATVTLNNTDGNASNATLNLAGYTSYSIHAIYKETSSGANDWHWEVTFTGSGNGGGTTNSTNEPGYYLYGDLYSTTNPSTGKMYYKLMQLYDDEYYLSVNAGSMVFNPQKYSDGNGTNLGAPNGTNRFRLAYVDAAGNVTEYNPSSTYELTSTDGTASTLKTTLTQGNTNWWNVASNGGMYTFHLKINADGTPSAWYYESDPYRMVVYRTSSTSNWAIDAMLYSPKRSDLTADYNKNFFGSVKYTKGESFMFFLYNTWYGARQYNPNIGWFEEDLAVTNNPTSANYLKFDDLKGYDGTIKLPSGVYATEFNPDRDYMIKGGGLPNRIFIAGPSVTSEQADGAFSTWDPSKAIELQWSDDDQAYKGTLYFTKDKNFRFLLDHQTSGSAVSLKPNFGEDSNTHSDTWTNNYVSINDVGKDVNIGTASDGDEVTGDDITFSPTDGSESGYYTIRFYVDRAETSTNFQWDNTNGVFHYTLSAPIRPWATVSPASNKFKKTETVSVNVKWNAPSSTTTSDVKSVIYTVKGEDITIDKTTGEATSGTKVDDASADGGVNIGSFKYDGTNIVDGDGNVIVANSNVLKVNAYAVRKISAGSGTLTDVYELSGSPATATYTFVSNFTLRLHDMEEVYTPKGVKLTVDGRGGYKYFTTYAQRDTYLKPDGVDAYIATTAEVKDGALYVVLTKVEQKSTDASEGNILPANCGLVLAAKDNTGTTTTVAAQTNGTLGYVEYNLIGSSDNNQELSSTYGANKLVPQYEQEPIYRYADAEKTTANYIWSAYTKSRVDNTITDKTQYQMGFWIVKTGGSVISASSAFLQMPVADMKDLIGSAYTGFNEDNNAAKVFYVLFKDNTTTGISKISDEEKVKDDAWYTLQGVRIIRPQTKGVYIHNGKKYVVNK